MKIAVVGSGISGLVAAWQLADKHQVTLFEQSSELGGHTATKQIRYQGEEYAIDTGFIVFNDWTYPNFNRFLELLEVDKQHTEMSFSVKNTANGLEYNGNTLASLFAQRRNLLRPQFYTFLNEILKFNKLSKSLLSGEHQHSDAILDSSLGDFLHRYQFSDYFSTNYILAMGAAIWSSGLAAMKHFPLRFFLKFFNNHGLLNISNRPQWSVIKGGSKQYIQALQPLMSAEIRLNSAVTQIRRLAEKNPNSIMQGAEKNDSTGVELVVNGLVERFDKVVLACHSDQALQLLQDATPDERQVLGDICYANNHVVLHTDESILPKRKAAWAAWNYYLSNKNPDAATLTYNMNILQGIQSKTTFSVTLNQSNLIDQDKILGEYQYAHPVYTLKSIAAQQQRALINGKHNTYFCGAYWYNGFHEDGIRSGLDVCRMLGVACAEFEHLPQHAQHIG